MTGKIHTFDARVDGGYRMSLFYPPNQRSSRGKTSDREDMVNVRFVELEPPRRIVEAVSFVTADLALLGEMTIVVTFDALSVGTEVTFLCRDLPPGPARRGQRGRIAIVVATVGPSLRMSSQRPGFYCHCERSKAIPIPLRTAM